MAEMIPSISFIWGGENWMSRNLFIFFKKISRAKNKTFQNNLKKKTKKKKQKRKEHSHQLSISTDTRAVATYYADSIHFWIFFSFFVFFLFFCFFVFVGVVPADFFFFFVVVVVKKCCHVSVSSWRLCDFLFFRATFF